MNIQKSTLQFLKKIYNSLCDIMTNRNARYEILGRHFYDCFTLFTTNKNKISYVVIDSDNTYTIKRFFNKNYLRAKRNSYANVTQ